MPVLDLENFQEVKRYNEFVENARYTSITQDLDWRNIKNNWQPLEVYLEERDKIVAAMSMLLIKNVGEKWFAYASKGPVLNTRDVDLVSRLVDEAESELSSRNVFLLRMDPEWFYDENLDRKLRLAGFVVRNRSFDGKAFIQPRFNMLVSVKDFDAEKKLLDFHKKTRYAIKQAIKNGAEERLSDKREDLACFYRLYEDTSQRHGISYRPREYFERLADAFLERALMKIAVIDIDKQAAATALLFKYGNRVWYMYAGSTDKNQRMFATYLLNWVGIRWAIEEDLDYYDLGGIFKADATDSLYVFKNKFVKPTLPAEYIGEIDKVYDEEAYNVFVGVVS